MAHTAALRAIFDLAGLLARSWALTLDPGGAKGGYAAGLLSGLFRHHPRAIDNLQVICGCSVGAFIAAKLAMHRVDPKAGHLRALPRVYRSMTRADLLGPLARLLDTVGGHLHEHGNILGNVVAAQIHVNQAGRLPIVDLVETHLPDAGWTKLFEYAERHPSFDLALVVTQPGSGQVRIVSIRDCCDPGYFRRAVLASGAIPFLFPPVQIESNGPLYVDGGVAALDPVHLMAIAGRFRHVEGVLAIHYIPYSAGSSGVPNVASTMLGMAIGTMASRKRPKPKAQPRQYGWCQSDGRNIPCIHLSPSSPLRLGVLDLDQPKMGRAVDKGVRDARDLK